MKVYIDLHIHSSFSIATAKGITIESIALWARRKGLSIVGTGDILHPGWRKECKEKLVPQGGGIYECNGVKFILSGEIGFVFVGSGKMRKVHLLLLYPDFRSVDAIANELSSFVNLSKDGRPTIKMSLVDFVGLVMGVSEDIAIIPAHIWTPWFGILGHKGGFESLKDAFGDVLPFVVALETGLSSDPKMGVMHPEVARFTQVSFSDAHSPAMLGREATVVEDSWNYFDIVEAWRRGKGLGTVEFFPQEGKYYYDGHRKCGVCMSPEEAESVKGICPVCGKPLTFGVLHRVFSIGDGAKRTPPHFRYIIPLRELIAHLEGKGAKSKGVERIYLSVLERCEGEIPFLMDMPIEDIKKIAGGSVADAVWSMRQGNFEIIPGYDGVFGKISVKI